MSLSTRNVQTTYSASDTTGAQTRTISYTVGAGTELLVVIARLSAGEVSAADVSAVRWADSGGGSDENLTSKVQRASPGGLGARVEIWYLANPTARAGLVECDYTVTTSGIRATSWTILEVIGGVDTAAPTGASANSNGTAAAAPLSLTSTVAGSLILSSVAHVDIVNDPYTPGAGITAELAEGNTAEASTGHSYWAGEGLTTTAGAYAVGATGSGASKNFAAVAFEVLPVVGAPSNAFPFRRPNFTHMLVR